MNVKEEASCTGGWVTIHLTFTYSQAYYFMNSFMKPLSNIYYVQKRLLFEIMLSPREWDVYFMAGGGALSKHHS